ncbi:hypothetical protein PATA110616_00235 [Paenibacillus tarimensis]
MYLPLLKFVMRPRKDSVREWSGSIITPVRTSFLSNLRIYTGLMEDWRMLMVIDFGE